MKKESVPTPWDEKKGKLKEQYPELSEEDLIYQKGNEEQLISHLQEKLSKSRGEIKQIIKNL